jgi:hypothetical protein
VTVLVKNKASRSKDSSTKNQLQNILDIVRSMPVKQTAVVSPSLDVDSKS